MEHFMKTSIITVLLAMSFQVSASLIDNGDFTTDTSSGLDWLDLTVTVNRSYNDITSKLGAGQEFEGWRYATGAEIESFWNAFGGNENYYTGVSSQNNGLFSNVAALWGDLWCHNSGCSTGEGYSFAITAEPYSIEHQYMSLASNLPSHTGGIENDFFKALQTSLRLGDGAIGAGSALVRTTVVPIPPAIVLFISGILGLLGITSSLSGRKKHATQHSVEAVEKP